MLGKESETEKRYHPVKSAVRPHSSTSFARQTGPKNASSILKKKDGGSKASAVPGGGQTHTYSNFPSQQELSLHRRTSFGSSDKKVAAITVGSLTRC
jgi:hypothetical protein